MASIGTIVAQLRDAADHLDQAVSHVRGSLDQAREIGDQGEFCPNFRTNTR